MKNVMRGLNDNASKALYNGVPVLGYIGKRDHPYEIDDKTAPIVQKIFKDYALGVPMQKIINCLNDGGIKTGNNNGACNNNDLVDVWDCCCSTTCGHYYSWVYGSA